MTYSIIPLPPLMNSTYGAEAATVTLCANGRL
jgi:hypothetical protein